MDFLVKFLSIPQCTSGKVNLDYRILLSPVPFIINIQSFEQRFVALEYLFQRVNEKTFPKRRGRDRKKAPGCLTSSAAIRVLST